MEFLEILGENWLEILSAVGTIVAIFLTRNGKKTAAERQALKVEKAKAQADKALIKAQKAVTKAKELEKGGNTQ